MSNIAQDIKTFIIGSTAIVDIIGSSNSARCHYNHIPEGSADKRVWFRVAGDTEERTLDKSGGLHEAYVDLECTANAESDAQSLADAIKNRLDGYQGTMGNSTVQGCWLSDKDDDYVPHSIPDDDGVRVCAFDVRMFYTT